MTTMTDEPARLAELDALRILDTPAEERFDQYTRLVADMLDVPTVLISLVDENRQWFKSAVGFDRAATDRRESFCAHALSMALLEIPDARLDARVSDNPLVTGPPYIRFYAGAVLHGPTGQPLGTLCVIAPRPRQLSADEKNRLLAFARLVEQEINLHQRFQTLTHDLQHAAFYDAITGLPSRGLIETHLKRSLEEARGQAVAVVHLQLTDVDALITRDGQQGCDRVLRTLASRLQQHVRPTDQVGRLDSDRFVLIMPGFDDSPNAIDRIRRLISQLAAPVTIGSQQRTIRLAAGIARAPDDATTARDLLDCARTALRYASDDDRNTVYTFYSRDTHVHLVQQHDRMQRLAEALQANALRQVYQPILSCQSGRIVAVEALARWHDTVEGDVSPGLFIPLIEANTEWRRTLTHSTLASACRQITAWDREVASTIRVSVNIPGGELYRDDFVALIRNVLDAHAVPPDRLVLELTEQSLIADIPAAIATIDALRALGVRFAIDDFGTGYSSLNYLKQLPLDTLKIDRGFIRDIATDPTTRALTQSIMGIAHTLGLSVVAEGIETEAQYRMLKQMACTYAQGFWFSRPVSAEVITEQLREA